ncbi:peptidase M23 [Tenacibaculum holothuriorum]|uniref:Peptidase M23 n=2 Tax=Tenacibaculum holothuriorum TaxID=1635173 RepID=A0A1Y2PDA8_9FLAO|nr:peptidase M23 [Tenacibaculum holothuriorum]
MTFFCCAVIAQKQYPKHYFSAPLKIPIILSGTFGELRSNHFHSGVDIKTLGKQGIPIYAPADGYISRLKVSQYGFGKALYMNHPNGYTTVYAHLKKYAPEVQAYIKKIQYKKKKYSTGNIFPNPEKFPIKKGQLLGYTGDSGSSGGPHLHYEIRDTETEHIINPMLFGLKPSDTKVPIFRKLMVYPLSEDARINNTAQKTDLEIKNLGSGKYIANRISASGTIGFGVNVFDRLDDALNKNGVYSLEMKINGNRVYYHDLETFSFPESKYINLLIDYPHYAKYRSRIQKTHKVKANKLSIYEDLINNGKIDIENGYNYNIEIIAKDFVNNTASIKIPVQGVASNTLLKKIDTTAYKIKHKEFNKFQQKNVTIAFPKNTFYEDCFLDFSIDNGIAKIHEPTIPLNKRYTLTFFTDHLNSQQKKQVYIANVTRKKYPRYTSTRKKENKVFTTTKSLGSYTLKYDSIPPTAYLVNFKNKQWVSKLSALKVKIKDKQSGINDYVATIDGDWVLMEYNHKKGILTYDFNDKKLVGSKHLFKLVVSDNVGNTKTISATFFRK